IHTVMERWRKGKVGLKSLLATAEDDKVVDLLQRAHAALLDLPWIGQLKAPQSSQHDLLFSPQSAQISLQNPFFIQIVIQARKAGNAAYQTKNEYRWLRSLGESLFNGSIGKIVTIANWLKCHSYAIVIDGKEHTFYHRDSLNFPFLVEHANALQWWLGQHFGQSFKHKRLPIQQQQDGFSCGVHAWASLSSFLGVQSTPSCESAVLERVEIFLRLVEMHNLYSAIEPENEPGIDRLAVVSSDLDTGTDEANESTTSSEDDTIRKAIERAEESGKTQGILSFFSKASEEKRLQDSQDWDVLNEHAEDGQHTRVLEEARRREIVKEQNKLWKRKQRNGEKAAEIRSGDRWPDGKKCCKVEANLAYSSAAVTAEDTRPARSIMQNVKTKDRKPQGRKKTRPDRPAKYHNWLNPMTWPTIQTAALAVGPRMSLTEIARELHKRNPQIFNGKDVISRNIIEGWIDRTGSSPAWKPSTLQ
ncbi:hypothetical protein AAF712_014665, partial [Marasmius tenuissimus]